MVIRPEYLDPGGGGRRRARSSFPYLSPGGNDVGPCGGSAWKRDPGGRPKRHSRRSSTYSRGIGARQGKPASRSLALDWTDVESFSTRRTKPDGRCADHEAARGTEERGEVLQLVRRMNVVRGTTTLCRRWSTCSSPRPVTTALGDVICDSGDAHRVLVHVALRCGQPTPLW